MSEGACVGMLEHAGFRRPDTANATCRWIDQARKKSRPSAHTCVERRDCRD